MYNISLHLCGMKFFARKRALIDSTANSDKFVIRTNRWRIMCTRTTHNADASRRHSTHSIQPSPEMGRMEHERERATRIGGRLEVACRASTTIVRARECVRDSCDSHGFLSHWHTRHTNTHTTNTRPDVCKTRDAHTMRLTVNTLRVYRDSIAV